MLLQCMCCSLGRSYCVDEGIRLLGCARHPGADVCAKEFVEMRECHRPGGPELVVRDNQYQIVPEHLDKYRLNSVEVCEATAPPRSRQRLEATATAMREALSLDNFKENVTPYKWESLRGNPGE
eukprot:GHVT01045943.1.p2 GENE.GHVT01045943.1~~GHVT01045943.1.p2  ORF type:complete len:124 (+),score=11.26 GHVT01045943.1:1201-1572(+)